MRSLRAHAIAVRRTRELKISDAASPSWSLVITKLGRWGRTRLVIFGFTALITLLLETTAAASADLALVLAIDVSASVTADSYVLQHDGIAQAFENPRLVDAISALPGGIEVLVLEWSDPDKIAITVGWTRVTDAATAAGFGDAVRRSKRSSNGLTAIGPALLAAAAAFDGLREPAARRVVDISGDGMANLGVPPAVARDRLLAAGIAINGLAILTEEPWLEAYYRRYVIGGPAAFLVVAHDFGSFAEAILRKLVQEVAGAMPGDRSIGVVGCTYGRSAAQSSANSAHAR
jgi:hypothetical protein